MKSLDNFTMLDLTHMLSGPFGAMLLTDLGMNTIKVEPPATGEGTRKLLANNPDYSSHGMGAYFLTLNRNKKSVALDLKSPEGKSIFLELVKKADVVLDNFSPGVTQRLGIDFEALKEVNPRIVTCSITGFGQTGPDATKTSFDLVAQAVGGGMSITGESGGRPIRSGIPIGDLGGGIYAALGILAALNERNQSGHGKHIDISMVDCQVSMLNYMATMYFMSGKNPGPEGNGHFVHVPYNTFRTATKDIVIAVIFDSFWDSLVEILDDEELKDPKFKTQPVRLANKTWIEDKLQSILVGKSCEEWLALLEARRIPCAPVNDFESVLNNQQIEARNMVASVVHEDGTTVRVPGNPIKFSDYDQSEPVNYTWPPTIGENTVEILTGLLNMPVNNLDGLAAKGVIGK
ncbi:MAG TPA: CaiB/BaiF CoA-transferase family protein [Marinobacter sp.]|nr:CaiB/BaiF CoA-transferase family protein [Marinobacter sp.]